MNILWATGTLETDYIVHLPVRRISVMKQRFDKELNGRSLSSKVSTANIPSFLLLFALNLLID